MEKVLDLSIGLTAHLCDSCRFEIPTCKGNKIIWGIDINPYAKGVEADRILECDAYQDKNSHAVNDDK